MVECKNIEFYLFLLVPLFIIKFNCKIKKMKNIKNVLLVGGILFSTLLLGQTNNIELGIEGGGSMVSLSGDGFIADRNVNDIGFVTGFSMLYHFNDHFSLKTNLFYERKGNMMKYFFNELPYDLVEIYIKDELETKHQLDYLTLPVLARYSFGKQKSFFVNAGGYVGTLLKSVVISHNVPKHGRYESDITRRLSRMDFGLSAGIGGQINITNNLIMSMELRSNFGLQNIGKDDSENYNDSKGLLIIKKDGLSNNTSSLLLGVSYRLSKSTKNDETLD